LRYALEAAHVIPSKDNGNEVVENGLLLRADLHRLFDAHKIFISEVDGTIEFHEDVTSSYKASLKPNVKLDAHIFNRVRKALKHRNKSLPRG
jgi:predicted restriction endonuclease